MVRYLIVSVGSGLLFGILDGAIHANPLAVKLLEAYKPIARTSINMGAGVLVDLVLMTAAIIVCTAAVWLYPVVALRARGQKITRRIPSILILGLIGFGVSLSNTIEAEKRFSADARGLSRVRRNTTSGKRLTSGRQRSIKSLSTASASLRLPRRCSERSPSG